MLNPHIRTFIPLSGLPPRKKALCWAGAPFLFGVVGFLLTTAGASTPGERLALLWKALIVSAVGVLTVRQIFLRTLISTARAEAALSKRAAIAADTRTAALREDVRQLRGDLDRLRRQQAQATMERAAAMFDDPEDAGNTAVDALAESGTPSPHMPRIAEGRPRPKHIRLAPEPED